LQEDIILGIGVVDHPLQQAPFDRHRGKDESA
jgi:hypothetical protein